MKIGDFCTHQFVVAEPSNNLLDAARRMRRENSEYLVVIEKKGNQVTPLGILTVRDIINQSILEDIDPETISLADIIINEPVITREDDDVDSTVARMSEMHIRYIPVVSNQGLLTGIFTMDDYINVLSNELRTLRLLVRREPPGGHELNPV